MARNIITRELEDAALHLDLSPGNALQSLRKIYLTLDDQADGLEQDVYNLFHQSRDTQAAVFSADADVLKEKFSPNVQALAALVKLRQDQSVPGIYGLKDVPFRLHPCLAEASPEKYQDPEHYDMLDVIVAARLYTKREKERAKGKGPSDGRPDLKKTDKPTRYLLTIDRTAKAKVRAAADKALAGGGLSGKEEKRLRLLAQWIGPYPEPRASGH